MTNKTTYTYYTYSLVVLILAGFLISGYLMFHHFALLSGQTISSDLCSTIFGKGCNNALLSNVSNLLGIPLGGWGLIYFFILGLFLYFSHWLSDILYNEMIQTAFWISFAGIFFSAFYVYMMIRFPVLFCPFCTVFHLINFTVFFLLKKSTGLTFGKLIKNLMKAFSYTILAKPLDKPFERWKWLPFVLAIFTSLALLQWVQIEKLQQRITKMAEYDPLKELEAFEARDIHEIPVIPEMPMLGPEDAPVTLIVFSDFQCSACALFASNFEDLIKYNQGKLRICFKHFPLGESCNPTIHKEMHPLACAAAYAAEAARQQGKFWVYHDSLFNKIENIKDPVFLFDIARSVGLNMDQFKTDYESETCKKLVSNNIAEGIKLEINATPAVFLNGRQVFDLRPNSLNFLIKYLAK